MRPLKTAPSRLNSLQWRRLSYVAILATSVLATIFLLRAQGQRETSIHDAAIRNAWQTEASPISGNMTIAAVRARFNITGGGAAGDLMWQVANANELRASLAALDLAAVKLREVKIARRGAGFSVSAEQIP